MKHLLLALLLSAAAMAQTTQPTATITATCPSCPTISQEIQLPTRTVLKSFVCIPVSLYPGDGTVCTATLNQAAPAGGFVVTVNITGHNTAAGDVPTGPVTLTVLAGQVFTTGVYTRPFSSSPGTTQLTTGALTSWVSNSDPQFSRYGESQGAVQIWAKP